MHIVIYIEFDVCTICHKVQSNLISGNAKVQTKILLKVKFKIL